MLMLRKQGNTHVAKRFRSGIVFSSIPEGMGLWAVSYQN